MSSLAGFNITVVARYPTISLCRTHFNIYIHEFQTVKGRLQIPQSLHNFCRLKGRVMTVRNWDYLCQGQLDSMKSTTHQLADKTWENHRLRRLLAVGSVKTISHW
jgi:hypothetical protein